MPSGFFLGNLANLQSAELNFSTNFRLLKETNRKGNPLSSPRAKVVKHPKHFQRVSRFIIVIQGIIKGPPYIFVTFHSLKIEKSYLKSAAMFLSISLVNNGV